MVAYHTVQGNKFGMCFIAAVTFDLHVSVVQCLSGCCDGVLTDLKEVLEVVRTGQQICDVLKIRFNRQ